jgi:ABC-type transporter Mla subunit MlaD
VVKVLVVVAVVVVVVVVVVAVAVGVSRDTAQATDDWSAEQTSACRLREGDRLG